MPTVCSNCGGTDIEYDSTRGDAVCTGCGSVLEDNIIVSEVTFQEQSSGSSSLVGQFVSNESGGGSRCHLSTSGFHHGMGRDSREVTLQHAKKRLTHLGNLLKLNQHCIDTAFGFFKMALQLNLTRGRKSSIMDTACLYLVCRSEGTPHMLLDFSDVLQINVYSLGRAYLKLSTALHINPPAIDPCLYIHRFAHKLELGDKVHNVSMTALRLVARMKRDWIHHGRRPAGLCGASLLVAARLHNFNRSVKEVSRVVKLSEGTIRKRLGDFRDTPSSRLTIDEFLKIDLEQEHDPPCFLEAKKKKAKQQLTTTTSATSKDPDSMEDSTEQDDDKSTMSDEELMAEDGGGEGSGFGGIKVSSVEDIIAKARMAEAFLNVPKAGLSGDLSDLAQLVEEGTEEEKGGRALEQQTEREEGPKNDIGSEESCSKHRENGELDIEGISDGEIEQMLLSDNEVRIKTQLWFAENADYLKELEEKREKQAASLAEKGAKSKKKPAKRKKKDSYQTPASTAGEAIERMLIEKKISAKINYDVLRDLDKAWSGGGVGGAETEQTESDQTGAASLEAGFMGFAGPSVVNTNWAKTGGNRLPSLTTRKRNLAMSGSSTSWLDTKNRKMEEDSSSLEKANDLFKASEEILATAEKTLKKSEAMAEVLHGPGGNHDKGSKVVIEESGPVQYEEERWGGDMDDMVYEGDPLLGSDYEEEDDYY